MISLEQKEKIKALLGWRYVSTIQEELRVLGLYNQNNEEHSDNMIRTVMNGKPHTDIEKAIFSAVEKRLKENKRREDLLIKKSVAATTD